MTDPANVFARAWNGPIEKEPENVRESGKQRQFTSIRESSSCIKTEAANRLIEWQRHG